MAQGNSDGASPKRNLVLVAGLPILAVSLVSASEAFYGEGPHQRAAAARPVQTGYGPSTFDEALARANRTVDLGRERVAQGNNEWLRHESLARGIFLRSRLTGDFADLAGAAEATRDALALAPAGSGPLLTWAAIGMSSHRLADTEAALAQLEKVAVNPPRHEQSEIAALRGDLAFYRGNLATAQKAYLKSIELDRNSGAAIRMARLAKARADFDEADSWLVTSLSMSGDPTPQMAAQVALHRGGLELARGNHTEARRHFERAEREFRGFWLAKAHLAQAKALDGDLSGAISDLESLADQTRSPEIMDALALYLQAAGRFAQSEEWISRSQEIWRNRMDRLPEAAIGHALEHELAFGDPARAVDLARRNLAIRPYGEAHLLMAQAFRQAGAFESARKHIELAKASGWRSAPLFALEGEVLSVLGEIGAANAARDHALSINPRIFDPDAGLVWFSHG